MDRRLPLLQLAVSFAVIAGRSVPSLGHAPSATFLLLLLAFTPASAGDGPPYPSSVVGTDFDFITESDPDTFVRLEDKGQGPAEMPDKADRSAPLVQQAFLFVAHFNDGTRVNLAIDADFETQDSARTEALRYTPRLGKLPTALRRGVDRVVVHQGGDICKDTKALADTGVSNRGESHYRVMFDATAGTDRLIELILQDDKDVLKQLLTTNKVVPTKTDNVYFGERRSKEEIAAQAVLAKKAAAEQAQKQAAKKNASAAKRNRQTNENPHVAEANLSGPKIYARVSRRSFGNGSMEPERILATAPEGQRLGILTHPSWLVSHSDAMDNHAILRGRWIRERLLGGGIPDVPITVDAMLPDEPQNTLRERMRVTQENYCWTCHKKMDPLGLPFELYNHAGLFRKTELNKPIETTGEIIDSGDPALDGKVANAIEMIQKLAESKRAEQVFVRLAFRFWMGRNETLNDAPVLQEAYRAYKDGGGSMKALVTSLLTSDAFLYRTRGEPLLRDSK